MNINRYNKLISGIIAVLGVLLPQFGVENEAAQLITQLVIAGGGLYALYRFPNAE